MHAKELRRARAQADHAHEMFDENAKKGQIGYLCDDHATNYMLSNYMLSTPVGFSWFHDYRYSAVSGDAPLNLRRRWLKPRRSFGSQGHGHNRLSDCILIHPDEF